jgi:hypothetical protein
LLLAVALFSLACGSSPNETSPKEGGTVCLPNTKLCKDGAVYRCNRTGSGSTLSEACDSGQYCIEADEDAACSDTPCKSGQPLCDGQVATVCKEDGSGPEAGGTSCADAHEVCVEGACVEQECAPNRKFCAQGNVYLCSENGLGRSLLAECGTDQVCDEAALTCRPKVCDRGARSCDGSKVVECNDFGSDWVESGVDCASSDDVCVDGACVERSCTAGATFCQGYDVYVCDAHGVTSQLRQACNAGGPAINRHCQQTSETAAACVNYDCIAGEQFCEGNTLKTCTAENTVPTSGTDCGDQVCLSHACYPKVCEPYAMFCQDGDIYQCDDDTGTSSHRTVQCETGTTCKHTPPNWVTCEPLACTPGQAACLANQLGVCAADSSSLASISEDCGAKGLICSAEGTCAASVVDDVPAEENTAGVTSGEFIGDGIKVTSSRTVTKLEANLVLPAPRDLRWVIYELQGISWVAQVDMVVTNQSGSGFFSSGSLDYTVNAGKNYVFGVVVDGGAALVYAEPMPPTDAVSFGTILGGVSTAYEASFFWDFYDRIVPTPVYRMRLTTARP